MGILDFLFRRAPRDEDPAPEFTVTVHVTVNHASSWTPDMETPETLAEEAPAKPARKVAPPQTLVATEPFFCRIKYTDASGRTSHRRVTVRRLAEHDGRYYLGCYCHERNAPRTFRLDRIELMYTEDGEIFEVADFIRDFVGFELPGAARPEPQVIRTPLMDHLRPALGLLVAAARSDRYVHPEETDAILLYVELEASALHRRGQIADFPTLDDLEALKPRVAAMRPTRTDVAEAMLAILDWDAAAFDRLGRALCHVIYADGKITDDETAFVADLTELRGRSGADILRRVAPWVAISEHELREGRW